MAIALAIALTYLVLLDLGLLPQDEEQYNHKRHQRFLRIDSY